MPADEKLPEAVEQACCSFGILTANDQEGGAARVLSRALLAEARRMVESESIEAGKNELHREEASEEFILSECERRYARKPSMADALPPEARAAYDLAQAPPPPPKEPSAPQLKTFTHREKPHPVTYGRETPPKEPEVEPCRTCGNKPAVVQRPEGYKPIVEHKCPAMLLEDWNERMRRSEWAPDSAARSSADDGCDETAWLIENAQGEYWWGKTLDVSAFIKDNEEAVRFARFEDGERVRLWLLGDIGKMCRTTQHAWVGSRAARGVR